MKPFGLLLVILSIAGCVPAEKDKTEVLASFDGTTITTKEFSEKIRALPKSVQAVAVDRKKDLIEDMAAEHFLYKEAVRQGLEKDPDVRKTIRTAEHKILIAKLIDREINGKIAITEDEIAKYYEFHKNEFMTPLSLRASHILSKNEADALEIKKALDEGADFENLARQRSADATAIRGGDLGFFQKGQFVPEFDEAVFGMQKGEIKGPVKTAFGYHVIRLNDRVEPRLRSLKAVRAVVEERLMSEKRSKAFKELVEKLKGNTKITVDEEALSRVSL